MANTNKSLYRDFARVGIDSLHDESFWADHGIIMKPASFPSKLFMMLSCPKIENIIIWLPHGRAWKILNPKEFETRVLPRYFKHGRISSFKRQLNGYGFRKINSGVDYGAYYHELFLRGMPHLCSKIRRVPKNSGEMKHRTKEDVPVPDFYALSRDNPLPEISSVSTDSPQSNKICAIAPSLSVAHNGLNSNVALKKSAPVRPAALTASARPATLIEASQSEKITEWDSALNVPCPLTNEISSSSPLTSKQAIWGSLKSTSETCFSRQAPIQLSSFQKIDFESKTNMTNNTASEASTRLQPSPITPLNAESLPARTNMIHRFSSPAQLGVALLESNMVSNSKVASSSGRNIQVSTSVQLSPSTALNQETVQTLVNLIQRSSTPAQPAAVLPASNIQTTSNIALSPGRNIGLSTSLHSSPSTALNHKTIQAIINLIRSSSTPAQPCAAPLASNIQTNHNVALPSAQNIEFATPQSKAFNQNSLINLNHWSSYPDLELPTLNRLTNFITRESTEITNSSNKSNPIDVTSNLIGHVLAQQLPANSIGPVTNTQLLSNSNTAGGSISVPAFPVNETSKMSPRFFDFCMQK